TSMASPHVAGVAALVISQGVTDPDAVEKVLKDTARPSKMKKDDGQNRYGAGLVDAAAAVKRAKVDFGGYELGIAFAGAALLLMRLRRLGKLGAGLGFAGFVTLVMGSSGLFFLPTFGLPGASLVVHGLPEWDLGLGGIHGILLLYSALTPIGAALLLYGRPKLRGLIAGLAIGVGAHLVFHAFFRTTELSLVPHALQSTWLALNALVSFATGYAVLRK